MKINIISSNLINPLSSPAGNILPAIPQKSEGIRLSYPEPDYKEFIPDAGTRRRMSRIVKTGVVAAVRCLKNANLKPDAIITATGLGCLADTEKFLKTIIDTHEQLLNPTPFIQSTFNTVGAQIAMISGNMNYNMTHVHRGFSFEQALLDAILKLKEKEADNILVGSYEETTDTSFEIMSRLGFCKKHPDNNPALYGDNGKGSISGEGAAFFMLSSEIPGNSLLKDLLMVYNADSKTIKTRLFDFLYKNEWEKDDIDIFISGENGDNRDQIYYDAIENQLNKSTIVRYKAISGEFHTVSSIAMWLGDQLINSTEIPGYLIKENRQRTANKILLYNHYKGRNHTFILLEKSSK